MAEREIKLRATEILDARADAMQSPEHEMAHPEGHAVPYASDPALDALPELTPDEHAACDAMTDDMVKRLEQRVAITEKSR